MFRSSINHIINDSVRSFKQNNSLCNRHLIQLGLNKNAEYSSYTIQHSIGVFSFLRSRSSHIFKTNQLSSSPNFSNIEQTQENIQNDNKLNSLEMSSDQLQADSLQLFDNINFKEIAGDDEETLNNFKLLLLEVDVMRQDGQKVPKKLTVDQWKELFSFNTRSQRLKLLKFLWLNEVKKESEKRKREQKRAVRIEKYENEKKESRDSNHIVYGFNGSTIFVRVYDTSINFFDNGRLIQAMQFGQNVVIDCGYINNMTPMENRLCAKQLSLVFADNRLHREPFNVHFCNMDRKGVLFNTLKGYIPTLDDLEFPMIIKEEHYLDLFPKDKLVYLTPHCRNELLNFNHDDIYIIGALVDKGVSEPLSMAKAKAEGIRMAQLPLDRYLHWGIGSKSLAVNQVFNILLDISSTGDWNTALRHVPRRKVRLPDEPIRDSRQHFNRGTTFDPPRYGRRSNRFY